MNRSSFVLVLLLLQALCGYAQRVEKEVVLYTTTQDFISKQNGMDALAILKENSAHHLLVKAFLDKDREKIKRSRASWALEYDGESYFNLAYSVDLMRAMLFVRFDIVGRYSAIFIDRDWPAIVRQSGPNYGGGAMGILMKDSAKWGAAWIDREGKKRWILLIDTEAVPELRIGGNTSSIGNFLHRREFEKLCKQYGLDLQDRKAKDLLFEEVVEMIGRMNALNSASLP